MSDPLRPDLAPYAGHMVTAKLKLGVEFLGAVADPGSTLVFTTSRRLSIEERNEAEVRIAAAVPGINVAVVDGFDSVVVARPGAA